MLLFFQPCLPSESLTHGRVVARRRTLSCTFFTVMGLLKVWQINLHHCRAASLNLEKEVGGENHFILLVQEPWIHKHRISGIPSGWKIFQDNRSIHPRACILTSPSVPGTLLSQFTVGDMVAVLLDDGQPSGRSLVLISCYLPYKRALPLPN